MDNSFIIMSAPNGARRQKSDHPNIPITPQEMAQCAEEILDAGTSILHLHVRDDDGGHSLAVERYKKSIAAIREAVGNDLIIQATTEAVGIYNRHEQMDMVKKLKPEAVSLALRELCPDNECISEFADFNHWLNVENIFPQYILYNVDDYKRFEDYQRRGVFHSDNPFMLFVFGSYTGSTDPNALNELKQTSINTSFEWAVCGFADNEKECISHAVNNSGHIRVGFENNILNDEKQLLENNAVMADFAANKAKNANRLIASADDVRNKFDLKG